MHFVALLSLAATVTAVATPLNHVLHEKRHAAPTKWIKRDAVQSESILPMRIGLKQRNLDKVSAKTYLRCSRLT